MVAASLYRAASLAFSASVIVRNYKSHKNPVECAAKRSAQEIPLYSLIDMEHCTDA